MVPRADGGIDNAMSDDTLVQLTERVDALSEGQPYYRLVLLVGPMGAGKTPLLRRLAQAREMPYLNLNLALSRRLLDLTSRERPLRVRRLVEDVIADRADGAAILDNIELLFEPSLQVDPLTLLQRLSRRRMVIAAWGGAYDLDRRVLTYARPGHPEYKRYDRPEGEIVTVAAKHPYP